MKIRYILLVLCLPITWVYSQNHTEPSDSKGIIQELGRINAELVRLAGENATVKTELNELNKLKVSLRSSVIATHKNCSALGYKWINDNASYGRFLLGRGTGYPLSSIGGHAKVALSVNEMPRHSHTQVWGQVAGRPGTSAHGSNMARYRAAPIQQTERTGGSGRHENMPPYRVVNFCIYR